MEANGGAQIAPLWFTAAMANIDQRFDVIDERFNAVNQRLDSIALLAIRARNASLSDAGDIITSIPIPQPVLIHDEPVNFPATIRDFILMDDAHVHALLVAYGLNTAGNSDTKRKTLAQHLGIRKHKVAA